MFVLVKIWIRKKNVYQDQRQIINHQNETFVKVFTEKRQHKIIILNLVFKVH